MTSTHYQHHYRIDPRAGVYNADCVGLVDNVVRRATPAAWKDLHEQLNIRRGYVPRPGRWITFLTSPLPETWKRIQRADQVRAGDIIVMGKQPSTRFVGHAVIVAEAPQRLTDGSYAVRIIDSTGTPHGSADTRLTDRRAQGHSGLGEGTIQLRVGSSGLITGAAWSIDGTGPRMGHSQIVVGRALR